MKNIYKNLFLAFLCIWLSSTMIAQNLQEVTILLNSDAQPNTQFGSQVAIDGNYAVIGASNATGTALSSGKVYVYKLQDDTWSFHQSLEASDASGADGFGSAVAIHNNTIVVGAPREDENVNGEETLLSSGSIYVFQLNGDTWIEQQKIVASDRGFFDSFGEAVGIFGDYIFVGVQGEDEDANGENTMNGAGSVYIFKLNGETWEQQQKIVPSDRALSDGFGYSIAIDNNILVVGARQEDEDASGENTIMNAGSVYIFGLEDDVWSEHQKIVASNRAQFDQFGHDVAIKGNTIIVSSEQTDQNTGAAYIFDLVSDIWTETQIITASDGVTGDRFGRTIAIEDGLIIVGTPMEDEDENGENTLLSAGSVYLYSHNGTDWNQTQKIVQEVRSDFAQFGASVAISGSNLLVGTPGYDEGDDFVIDGAGLIFQPGCPDFELGSNSPDEICSGNSVILSANSSAGIINWFDSEDSNVSISSGTDFSTPVLEESTSYWVEAEDGECTSERIQVDVIVNPSPELSVSTDLDPICAQTSITLLASSDIGVINWFLSEDGIEPEFTGIEFLSEILTENTSYWVEAESGNCLSERVEILVIVNPIPDAPSATTPQQITSEGNTLADLVVDASGELTWYSDETLSIELDESTSLEDGMTYFVTQTIDGCESDAALILVEFTVGLEEKQLKGLKAYPNPVKDFLTIDTGENRVERIQVFNVLGELILDIEKEANRISSIDFNSTSPGIYILHVDTQAGYYQLRVIKE